MKTLAVQTGLILRNDLRLLWRSIGLGKQRVILSGSLTVGLFVLVNVIGIAVFLLSGWKPALGHESVAWYFFAFLMLGASINQSIGLLFDRADFDLLLTSPISPAAVLLARMATITCGAALSTAFLLLPMVNGAIVAISWHYVAGYATCLLLSCAVASTGIWSTLLLVRVLGPRRARTWAQVFAALIGAAFYIVIKGQSFMPMHSRTKMVLRLVRVLEHPFFSVVARAGRGEPWPFLSVAGVALALALLTARLLAKVFVDGLRESGGTPVRTNRRGRPHHFTQGALRATFLKDVRLIRRDPLLIVRILPRVLYILPAMIGLYRYNGLGMLAPLALFLTTELSVALTAVSASGEECWDLIRMSPTPELRLRLAKLAAGLALPSMLCLAMGITLSAVGRPWLALITIVFSVGCAAGCSWLQVARIMPTPRHDLINRKPYRQSRGRIVNFAIELVGAFGLGLAASGSWAIAAILLGAAALAVIGCFVLVDLQETPTHDFSSGPTPV